MRRQRVNCYQRPAAPERDRNNSKAWVAFLAAAWLLSVSSVDAQQRLYLQAVDALDAIVTDLGRDAVIVRENGTERRVVNVRPPTSQ